MRVPSAFTSGTQCHTLWLVRGVPGTSDSGPVQGDDIVYPSGIALHPGVGPATDIRGSDSAPHGTSSSDALPSSGAAGAGRRCTTASSARSARAATCGTETSAVASYATPPSSTATPRRLGTSPSSRWRGVHRARPGDGRARRRPQRRPGPALHRPGPGAQPAGVPAHRRPLSRLESTLGGWTDRRRAGPSSHWERTLSRT